MNLKQEMNINSLFQPSFSLNFFTYIKFNFEIIPPPLGRALIEDSLLRFLLKKDYELEAGNEYKFTISAKF